MAVAPPAEPQIDLSRFTQVLAELDPMRCCGRVIQVIGLTVEAVGLTCQMGEICHIVPQATYRGEPIMAEVVGFRDDRVLLMPLGEMTGIAPGNGSSGPDRGDQAPFGLSTQAISSGLRNQFGFTSKSGIVVVGIAEGNLRATARASGYDTATDHVHCIHDQAGINRLVDVPVMELLQRLEHLPQRLMPAREAAEVRQRAAAGANLRVIPL